MKKPYSLLLATVALSVFVSQALPQPPISYYPHAVGNLWQYRSMFTGQITATYRIERDSLAPNGSRFLWFNHTPQFPSEEIDTLFQVWEYGRGRKPYMLAAGFGQSWRVNPTPPPFDSARVVDVSNTTVFGESVTVKKIVYWQRFSLGDSLWYGSRYLATGFGLVRFEIEPSDIWYLAGAIIDSIQWGQIVRVGELPTMPQRMTLHQNFPNPFNPSTVISYDLPQSGHLTLKVFDIVGKEVATLVDGKEQAGRHSVQFQPLGLASGVYIYRLVSDGAILSKKMMHIK